MPKAYWIANVTVTDPDAYQGYQALAPAAFAEFGARFLARGEAETLEGRDWQRRVVIEFASLKDAKACYNSPAYRAARDARSSACEADIAIIEGLE
ncbi:DUF1330 domain-containing protein [Sulfitobacter donghicola]|uniref:DUF1330 domain-containing protein n=1 Tax=Sulfitobacter donghicola DSW-25 = KCTC 12864 = JCM 14565 TaxID=1300350 RepID=A0A073IKK0_9RHOB|nr:DUF1330 domain-containing protein [Sulfitobacter donghicola]KEJ90075.1 hypothetical protein DSW25_07665 [Sulfitobacter donghicola DSW-25 = KCTC 12864 = JCM 14565]